MQSMRFGHLATTLRTGSVLFFLLTTLPAVVCATDSSISLPILATTSIETLDPAQSVEAVQYGIDAQIFEGLVAVGASADIVPALAASWQSSADFAKWRFRLREAYFQDDACFPNARGRRVTAADVVYSLTRGLDVKGGSKGSWALSSSVLGAEEFAGGKSSKVAGLRAIDSSTVEIVLKRGDRYFLPRLSYASTFILPPEAVRIYGGRFGLHPVGTGPYRLAAWKPGQEIVLERNPRYGTGSGWQPERPSVPRITNIFYRSEAQMAAAFARGEIAAREIGGADIADLRGPDMLEALSRKFPNVRIVQAQSFIKTHLLAVDMGSGAVLGADPALRRAVSQAFPRARLERDILRGTGIAQSTVIPAVLAGYRKTESDLAHGDPHTMLKKHLAGKTLRLAYVSSRTNDAIVSLLREIFSDAGAQLLLFPSTSVNALFSTLATSKPDITLIYWQPIFPNVVEYVTALLSASRPVPNFTGYANSGVDAIVAALRVTGDQAEIDQLAAQLSWLLDADMPWIPIYRETPLFMVSPKLLGFSVNGVGVVYYRHLKLAP